VILTEVWVPGHPRTKGSLDVKGGYATDTPLSKRWRVLVAEAVRRDISRRYRLLADVTLPYAGPVAVWFAAWIPRPGLRSTGPEPAVWHNAGDADKLARNVLDALGSPREAQGRDRAACASLYVDDNQVVRLSGEKFAATEQRPPGILIVAMALQQPSAAMASAERAWFDTAEHVRQQSRTTSALDRQVLKR
jgi:hypothetical protein